MSLRSVAALLLLVGLVAPVPAAAQVLGTSTISSASASCTETGTACVRVSLAGVASAGIRVVGAGTYTLEFEVSADNGTTWTAPGAVDTSDYTRDTSTAAPGLWVVQNAGHTHLRVRASAYTSGTPVVTIVRGFGGVTAPLSAGSISGANAAASATGAAVPSSASFTGVGVGATLRGWTGLSLGSHFAGTVAVVDGSGNQVTSFGGANASVSATAGAVPASATYAGLNIGGNLVGATGFSLGTARALAAAIVDGSGNQITSFGGGTQYATGTAAASPTGTTALGHDGSNVRALATDTSGRLYTRTLDPCTWATKVSVPINVSTAATTELINGTGGGNYAYICGVFLGPTAGAQNATLVEDDTDNCASPTAGIFGGTSAGSGWNFAANGGTNIGNGAGTVARTAATNVYVCLITSAAVQISGTVVYALAP